MYSVMLDEVKINGGGEQTIEIEMTSTNSVTSATTAKDGGGSISSGTSSKLEIPYLSGSRGRGISEDDDDHNNGLIDTTGTPTDDDVGIEFSDIDGHNDGDEFPFEEDDFVRSGPHLGPSSDIYYQNRPSHLYSSFVPIERLMKNAAYKVVLQSPNSTSSSLLDSSETSSSTAASSASSTEEEMDYDEHCQFSQEESLEQEPETDPLTTTAESQSVNGGITLDNNGQRIIQTPYGIIMCEKPEKINEETKVLSDTQGTSSILPQDATPPRFYNYTTSRNDDNFYDDDETDEESSYSNPYIHMAPRCTLKAELEAYHDMKNPKPSTSRTLRREMGKILRAAAKREQRNKKTNNNNRGNGRQSVRSAEDNKADVTITSPTKRSTRNSYYLEQQQQEQAKVPPPLPPSKQEQAKVPPPSKLSIKSPVSSSISTNALSTDPQSGQSARTSQAELMSDSPSIITKPKRQRETSKKPLESRPFPTSRAKRLKTDLAPVETITLDEDELPADNGKLNVIEDTNKQIEQLPKSNQMDCSKNETEVQVEKMGVIELKVEKVELKQDIRSPSKLSEETAQVSNGQEAANVLAEPIQLSKENVIENSVISPQLTWNCLPLLMKRNQTISLPPMKNKDTSTKGINPPKKSEKVISEDSQIQVKIEEPSDSICPAKSTNEETVELAKPSQKIPIVKIEPIIMTDDKPFVSKNGELPHVAQQESKIDQIVKLKSPEAKEDKNCLNLDNDLTPAAAKLKEVAIPIMRLKIPSTPTTLKEPKEEVEENDLAPANPPKNKNYIDDEMPVLEEVGPEPNEEKSQASFAPMPELRIVLTRLEDEQKQKQRVLLSNNNNIIFEESSTNTNNVGVGADEGKSCDSSNNSSGNTSPISLDDDMNGCRRSARAKKPTKFEDSWLW